MDFRNYEKADQRIRETYKMMRTNQTYEFVGQRIREYEERPKQKIDIWDAMNKLNEFVDQSDPDITIPNLYHLFQTAEGIRKDGKPEWMQVTGLIHDLGKLMYLWGSDETGTTVDTQWAIVGDTFVTGCQLPESLVHPEFNILNPDSHHHVYSTKYGMYKQNIGLSNCRCSWGHDEYLYRVLKHNQTNLPESALYIIRFHSLYPWHNEGEYKDLMDSQDHEMLQLVQDFNKYDLYTKSDMKAEELELYIKEIRPYYEDLVKRYIGDELYF
jgi:inositol oxygenase